MVVVCQRTPMAATRHKSATTQQRLRHDDSGVDNDARGYGESYVLLPLLMVTILEEMRLHAVARRAALLDEKFLLRNTLREALYLEMPRPQLHYCRS